MTALILTPAAIRAAIGKLRTLGREREDDAEAAAFLIDGMQVIEELLDPAHQARDDIGSATHAPPVPKPIDPSPRFMRPDTGETHGELDELLHDADWYTPTAIIDLWKGSRRYVVRTAIGDAAGDVDGHDWDIFDSQAQAKAFCASAKAPPAPPTIELPAGPGDGADAPMGNRTAAGAPPAPEAPPPAQAAAGHPIVRRRTPRGEWTPARDDLLRAEGPTEIDRSALLGRVNALPGPPIPSVNALHMRLTTLGVRLTDDALREARAISGARGGAAPRQPQDRTTATRTPERSEALRALWIDPALSVPQVTNRLNELPGERIVHPQALYKWARALGLPTKRPAPGAPPQPAPEPGDAIAMPIDVRRPADLPAEDHDDGDARIRSGWNPRQIADWFGCSVADAEAWCRTLREADQVAAELARGAAA